MKPQLILTFLLCLLIWFGRVYSTGLPLTDTSQTQILTHNPSSCAPSLVELNRVNKSIQKFLQKHPDLSTLQPSCSSLEGCMDFQYNGKFYTQTDYEWHVKEYPLKVSKADLMNTFQKVPPGELWRGDAQFQLSYDHQTGTFAYQGDQRGGLKEGELILVEIRVKLANMLPLRRPTAFEILSIDPEKGEVSFSYTNGMKSKGIQCIEVRENGDQCIVKHTSKYLSGSEFRDKKLYVTHHEKLLDSFYARLETMVQQREVINEQPAWVGK